MRYLHTMVRVSDLETGLAFWRDALGLVETRRHENAAGRFTLVYLAAPLDQTNAVRAHSPELELTWNWDHEVYTGGRNFGHLAYAVDDIYATCERLHAAGAVIVAAGAWRRGRRTSTQRRPTTATWRSSPSVS